MLNISRTDGCTCAAGNLGTQICPVHQPWNQQSGIPLQKGKTVEWFRYGSVKENTMTAIEDLLTRIEKLEQFKINLEKPMMGVQHLLMRVEELEKQAKHERFNEDMRQLNQDWQDATADPIQAAVLAERERCAKVAESVKTPSWMSFLQGWIFEGACLEAAHQIRTGEATADKIRSGE